MKCEKCGIEHDGKYASGRFCSSKCSRSFSTSSKRDEINEKVSKKLKNRSTKTLEYFSLDKICPSCKHEFLARLKKQKYCSRKCRPKCVHSDEFKEKIRQVRFREIEKGNVGYGIKTSFNGIRCDSALEYAFLKKYLFENPTAKIERFKGFLRSEDDKVCYQPDFLIDDKIIVEVKYTKMGLTLSEKWGNYILSQESKKNLLIKQKDNGFDYLWVTEKDIGLKHYCNCLKEIHKMGL